MIAAFKTAGFGYTFINDNAGVPETERNRKGVAGVAAQDYARQASAFFGDRPLDNPGYSKMELTGEVKVGSTNRLDVLKVEQRLKYLGFPAMKTGTGNIIKNFTVDGILVLKIKLHSNCLRKWFAMKAAESMLVSQTTPTEQMVF